MVHIYLVIQIDKDKKVLGIKAVFLSREEADNCFNELQKKEYNFSKNWPIWSILDREVAL